MFWSSDLDFGRDLDMWPKVSRHAYILESFVTIVQPDDKRFPVMLSSRRSQRLYALVLSICLFVCPSGAKIRIQNAIFSIT